MKKYLIYIPVALMLLIQVIDKDGGYRVYQILLLTITIIWAIVQWKYRNR